MMFGCLYLIFVAMFLQTAHLLQITSFYVPRRASTTAPIDCKYNTEGGKLYDVKWYKDGEQFFRCIGDGTVQEFPVEGVTIEHFNFAAVGSCPLTLTALTAKSAGEYKCEVSLDAPSFHTASNSSRLDLITPSKRTQDDSESEEYERQTSNEESDIISSGNQNRVWKKIFILFFIVNLCLFK